MIQQYSTAKFKKQKPNGREETAAMKTGLGKSEHSSPHSSQALLWSFPKRSAKQVWADWRKARRCTSWWFCKEIEEKLFPLTTVNLKQITHMEDGLELIRNIWYCVSHLLATRNPFALISLPNSSFFVYYILFTCFFYWLLIYILPNDFLPLHFSPAIESLCVT